MLRLRRKRNSTKKRGSMKGRLLRRWLLRRGAMVMQLVGRQAYGDVYLVRETRRLAPLLVQDAAALHILACVRAARRLGGAMAEAGVFAGGTARLICEEKGDAALHLFDVFELLQSPPEEPEPSRFMQLRKHFGTVHATRAQVQRLLGAYPGVRMHAGVFPATAQGLEDERFSFVHVDVDLEPSTRDALEFFHPRLLPGGILVGDDYHDPGVRRAFDQYFAGRADTVIELPWGQAVVVKAADRDAGAA
ncbi:MAG TPA: class I SAM-dependent methyltransferase [Longimicrobium sp.]|nr:class I SAM-dependent methyltransferase [Longimicrobium sp.]